MRQGYFWPMYGDADEIVSRYTPIREHRHVQRLLRGFRGTLLRDGYDAYAAYARNNTEVTHVQFHEIRISGLEWPVTLRLRRN